MDIQAAHPVVRRLLLKAQSINNWSLYVQAKEKKTAKNIKMPLICLIVEQNLTGISDWTHFSFYAQQSPQDKRPNPLDLCLW